jgi:hypothetical protein
MEQLNMPENLISIKIADNQECFSNSSNLDNSNKNDKTMRPIIRTSISNGAEKLESDNSNILQDKFIDLIEHEAYFSYTYKTSPITRNRIIKNKSNSFTIWISTRYFKDFDLSKQGFKMIGKGEVWENYTLCIQDDEGYKKVTEAIEYMIKYIDG